MHNRHYTLTDRDLAVLASLEQVRYLTVEHVQWLHWQPQWRASAKAAREAGQMRYGPKNAYRRLRALALSGLVKPIVRVAERGVQIYRRLPNVYTLTQQGAALLAAERGNAGPIPHVDRHPQRALMTLEHHVAIGAAYAALRSELEYRGRQLEQWVADYRLSADYDSVVVPSRPRPLPVLPDASFTLDAQRYFVEIDRGTTSTERWRTKALAHRAYAGSAALQARYGVRDFAVLVIAPTCIRVAAIARTIAAVYAGASPRYRFLEQSRVHPTLIRRKWHAIDQVSFLAAGQRVGETTVTFRECVLWTPQPGEQP